MKKRLNCDWQQFHQYQQNEPLPEHKIYHDIGHPCAGLGKAQKCGGSNLLMGSLYNWISNNNTDTDRQSAQIHIHAKKPLARANNEWQHKDEQYNSRVSECS